MRAGLLALMVVASTVAAQAQTVLKKEPAMGAMREGEVVFVDDGKCPRGQVRQVTGGNHDKVGGTKKIVRTSRCVPAPKA